MPQLVSLVGLFDLSSHVAVIPAAMAVHGGCCLQAAPWAVDHLRARASRDEQFRQMMAGAVRWLTNQRLAEIAYLLCQRRGQLNRRLIRRQSLTATATWKGQLKWSRAAALCTPTPGSLLVAASAAVVWLMRLHS